jgi:DNA-binding NarL/FixJ family response regulator
MQWPEAGNLWLRVFGFPRSPGIRIHCAVDATREERMESYLRGLCVGHEPELRLQSLSARERQVLAALAAAERPEEIARRLHLSTVTVRNHIQHILRKLDLHSTSAAVAEWLLDSGSEGCDKH